MIPRLVLAITDAHLFGFEVVPIAVVCKGEEIGRTRLHEGQVGVGQGCHKRR